MGPDFPYTGLLPPLAIFMKYALGAGKALTSGALRPFFTSTAPHHPGGKQDDSEHSD
jgi:hypothetical protein